MRKITLLLLILFMSLNFFNISNAKMYKIGTKLEKQLQLSKKFILPISEGQWEVIDNYNIQYYFNFKGTAIARIENNELMELIMTYKGDLSGESMGFIDSAVNEITFKDKYDGCYERPEYYLMNVYKKGGTHNCITVRHVDINKELFAPDDPQAISPILKQYLRENSTILPPIYFFSRHSYFSRVKGGDWYVIRYMANPKIFNSPKINNITEDTSEFHKANISQFPEHKKTMDKWLSLSAKRHQYIEKILKAKDRHLLDLDKYILKNEIDNTKDTGENKTFIKDLEKLNELYKSGVITKEEFEKAKKQILN